MEHVTPAAARRGIAIMLALTLPLLVFWLDDPADPISVIVLCFVTGIAVGSVWQSWLSLVALSGLWGLWAFIDVLTGIVDTAGESPLSLSASLAVALLPALIGAALAAALSEVVGQS